MSVDTDDPARPSAIVGRIWLFVVGLLAFLGVLSDIPRWIRPTTLPLLVVAFLLLLRIERRTRWAGR